jgi:glutamate-5-semialdehyde dehydrogenase
MNLRQQMIALARRARIAGQIMHHASTAQKNRALFEAITLISASSREIAIANQKDVSAAKATGLSPALQDRLILSSKRLDSMIKGLQQVQRLPDPVGKVISRYRHPDGARISRQRVPLGAIFIIYESRPNVTVDSAGLCLKAGNAVILRGGREAYHSNQVLSGIFRRALKTAGLPVDACQLVPTVDRRAVDILLSQNQYLDLVIPRGGEALIHRVTENSLIPVLKHYKGVCHIYLHYQVDLPKACRVIENAKCQRPAVCNALETLLVDRHLTRKQLTQVFDRLIALGVELRVDRFLKKMFPGMKLATEKDWPAEYLDLTLAVKTVGSVEEAMAHIRKYGSGHTDAILTKNRAIARKFIRELDTAAVLWNASTRLHDGYEFGLGAEIGISTDKLHARGPMGLDELTTYKWIVEGNYQTRS